MGDVDDTYPVDLHRPARPIIKLVVSGRALTFIRNENGTSCKAVGRTKTMSQFVRVFRCRLKGAALILVAFAVVNPFMLMRANMSPCSRPNIRTRAGMSENWCGYVAVSNLSSPASGS